MIEQVPEKEEKTYKTAAYSALTLVLLVFIVQTGISLGMNILRNIDIYAKLQKVKQAHNYSLKRNNNLKNELKSFNSAKSLESIARNNLKMAGINEILLIINSEPPKAQTKQSNKEKAVKEKGIFYKR